MAKIYKTTIYYNDLTVVEEQVKAAHAMLEGPEFAPYHDSVFRQTIDGENSFIIRIWNHQLKALEFCQWCKNNCSNIISYEIVEEDV